MNITQPNGIARRHDLDALRAIAMLLGILLHAGLSFAPFPWPVQDTQQSELYGLMFSYIHGFRMPLFFLLSGFFTTMLWRKRGLSALLWHRFKRIFLPLVVFWVLVVVPMIVIIILIVMFGGSNQSSQQQLDDTIWGAIRAGDAESVQQYIDDGVDIKTNDPNLMIPPLSVAAIYNRPNVADVLLQSGVDINAQNQDGSTALHTAAFFGYPEFVEVLIKHNADPTIKSQYDQIPVETTEVDWAITKPMADTLQLQLTQEEVDAGREQVKVLLDEYEFDPSSSEVVPVSIITNLQNNSLLGHLWFLSFLCWMVAGFAVYAAIADAVGLKRIAGWFMMPPVCFIWLIPLTLLPQWEMSAAPFGPDPSDGVIPKWHVLAYYALFFGYGALYFDTDDQDGKIGWGYWWTIPLATLVVFPICIDLNYGVFGIQGIIDPALHSITSDVLQVIFTWLMTLGLIGLFLNHFSGENKWMRYISDSSYWLYITHLPLVFIAQWFVRTWEIPSFIKFMLILIVIVGFLLLTYEWMVRYTFIGRFLNGPRKRPEKIQPPVEEVSA